MKRILAALALCVCICSSAFAGTPLSPYSFGVGNPTSPTSFGYSVDTYGSIINSSQSLLPKWHSAIGNVMSGSGNAKILFIGDSTLFYGSDSTNSLMRNKGIPRGVAKYLTSYIGSNGVVSSENWMGSGGNHGTSSNTAQYDSRISVGSGWNQAFVFPGGYAWVANATTGNLAFTPSIPVDTFVIQYIQVPGGGTFSYNFNGFGGGTQYSGGASLTLASKTVTTSLGTNTININWSSGANVDIIGVYAYNSASKNIILLNAGWPGSLSTDINSMYTGAGNPLSFGQDLTIICLGINDWNVGTPISTFESSIQSWVDYAKSVGDVIIMTPTPSDTSIKSKAIQDSYVLSLKSVARRNGIPVIDIYNRWISYTISNSAGMYYDSAHPNSKGYYDQSRFISNFLWD